MTIIRHGKLILTDRILEGYALVVEDGLIKKIIKDTGDLDTGLHTCIDAEGGYVSPGFIDIHSDYIEHIAAPRHRMVMDLERALYEFEKECVTHGITTMYHSVSLWEGSGSKPLRFAHNIKMLSDIIEKSHNQPHLIHNRLHVRYEIDNMGQFDLLMHMIEHHNLHLLSFMDHTPGQGQYRDIEYYRQYLKKAMHLDDQIIDQELQRRMNAPKLAFSQMKTAADLAVKKGIAIASHDDDTHEKLSVMRGLNASISEFPITLDIATHAHEMGFYTLVGAPNILLGGSSTGNLSAAEAIKAGVADILCSDYYPPALLHSAFQMFAEGIPLYQMINMLSDNPAKAVGIDHLTGSIVTGKRADLLIIRMLPNNFPAITHVMVEGKLINKSYYRG